MDAYDIFKKLTKGLTFKHRVLGVKNKDQLPKCILKKEKVEQQCDLKETEEIQDAEELNDPQTDTELEDSDDEIQVVKGAESELVKKEKKKKSKLSQEELKNKLEIEEQNHFRNEHGIKTVGRHVPNALKDFNELVTRHKLSEALVDTVIKCGYSEPTAIQRQAIPCILENRQIVACAPTGSGKTAAFLVPLLHILGTPQGGPRALVLCPTRELANQIYREALRLSASTQLRCSVIRSLKESKIKERESTIKKSDIVISTPNRLCYLLNQDTVGINLDKVQWLIIDEADKLFEGSPEEVDTFRQQLDVIISSCKSRLAMFSATHTPSIGRWARHNMKGLINITVGQRNAASSSVEQELLFCGNESGKLVSFRQLVQKGLKPPVLVFVQSKERAKELFKELLYDGVQVDVIHADRTQAQRDKVVRSFRVGRVWVLLCTELMARGIDFRGVNLVVNYDLPPSAISYIHRVGRAGRAGVAGRAVTFFTLDDVVNLRSIAAVMKQSGCDVPEYMLKLKQNPNKRKILLKKAPHRDKISTIVQKPEKRKLDDVENEPDKTKDTENIKNGKNKKKRKVQNEKQNNKNQKENINKSNKLGNKKRKKKKTVKTNV